VGRRSPAVRSARRTATLILATTEASKHAIQSLGANRVPRTLDDELVGAEGRTNFEVLPNCALADAEFHSLTTTTRDPNAYRIVSVGRLEFWKGLHLVIEAMQALVREVPHAELHIVGSGPAEAHLRHLVATLRLEDDIRFLGQLPRPDVLTLLANSHAFVHPSFHDSGGWATLEAAAVGLPVVCLDIGGPALQVTPQTGIKIPVDDAGRVVPLMAQALAILADDPRHAAHLGAAGRKRVGEHFTWDRLGDRLASMAPYSKH
jgi:glycosyltransferase involved in cell wall biosynthesis